jgi:hypothetical protein
MGRDLNEVLREAGPEKIKSMLGENFAWYFLYELPFEMGLVLEPLCWVCKKCTIQPPSPMTHNKPV